MRDHRSDETQSQAPPGQLLTLTEAADYLRLTPSAMYTQRHRGNKPGALGIRVGRKILYRPSDIERFLDEQLSEAQVSLDQYDWKCQLSPTRTPPAGTIHSARRADLRGLQGGIWTVGEQSEAVNYRGSTIELSGDYSPAIHICRSIQGSGRIMSPTASKLASSP